MGPTWAKEKKGSDTAGPQLPSTSWFGPVGGRVGHCCGVVDLGRVGELRRRTPGSLRGGGLSGEVGGNLLVRRRRGGSRR